MGAHREGEVTVVTVPERMPLPEVAEHARALHRRLVRSATRRRLSDSALTQRAGELGSRYLPEAPAPSAVNWSSRQQRRWGSCTPADRTIRISARLQDAPQYVIDYVLLHELAHLLVPDHSPRFTELVERFPSAAVAKAFLAGADFASWHPPQDELDK